LESNWRYNVPECGMVGLWTGLAARLLPIDPSYQRYLVQYGVPGFVQWWFRYPDSLPEYGGVFPRLTPHYPYGYNVEPDNP